MTGAPDVPEAMRTALMLERRGTAAHPVIVAHGEIDVATSPLLRSELAAALALNPQDVSLDLGDVPFVDSSGLGVMVGALKRLRESGGDQFAIVDPQDSVRKVLDITGLTSLFAIGSG